MIPFDTFALAELKTARIDNAERIEGSEKLIKLQVSLGEEKRQIIAGIAKSYSPEELEGRMIIIVANLEPRTLMGYESQGMLLAATNEEGNPILITPEGEVEEGVRIK